MTPRVTSPLPKSQPMSSKRPGQPVCRKCRKGYGSKLDGICEGCRGKTAWAAYLDHDIK